jgi:hypothetical protein
MLNYYNLLFYRHIKKKGSHEEVTTKMKMVMLPLTDLLGANMRLSFFEVNYDKPENREECSFKVFIY